MHNYYDKFSDLAPEDKLLRVREMRDEAFYSNIEWLESAELAHKFKSGDQWSDEEKEKLRMQNREALVWNYIHSLIELVLGVAVQNPIRIYPYPVERDDDFLCEILEDLITYVDTSQIDADAEHLALLENAVITGVGDVVVDVGPDPDNPEEILLYERALESYEALVDPQYKQANLKDARYVLYDKWVTAEDFKIRYPKHVKDMEEIFTEGVSGLSDSLDRTSSTQTAYTEQSYFEFYDSQNKRILVTHFEYREAYKRYYFIDETGKSTEIEKKDVKKYKSSGQTVEIYDTRVHWMHYIHDRILWEGKSPVYKKNFSLSRLTAYTDKSKRKHQYYGLVKLLIDPQKECNRRWLHTLKLLSSQGVGVMAEIDAFHDLTQASDSWSDPDAITFMAKGGLNKVREKSVPVFPDATMRLEEMNKEAIKTISGINPDLMGIAQQRREPGINLKLRQKQGLTMLSKIFENYKKTLKEIYMRKAEIIARYMPDTQIRKILGETDKYTFQQGYIIDQKRGLIAPIRKIRDLEYNIRIEDAPGGMNKMMHEFALFMDMLEKGFPTNPEVIIDKMDLSPIEKSDWKGYIKAQQESKQKEMQMTMQMEQAKMQVEQQKHADTMGLKAKEIEVMLQKNQQMLMAQGAIEKDKLFQKNTDSKRKFAVELAKLDANEFNDLVSVIKMVSEERLRNNATPANGQM